MAYFVVEMALRNGEGPVTDGTHDVVVWEVWNEDLVSVATFSTMEAAEYAARVINEDLYHARRYGSGV